MPHRHLLIAVGLGAALAVSPVALLYAEEPATQAVAFDVAAAAESVESGVAYLVANQHPSGGWAQGEVSEAMRGQIEHDPSLLTEPNVADTAMALLALIRSGHEQTAAFSKGVSWVCGQVENAPADSPLVTLRQGTCAQKKLGNLVDTFTAAWMLTEAVDVMPDGEAKDRAAAALQVCVDKMENHIGDDGKFQQHGWATALSQGVATRALNQAERAGIVVDDEVLASVNESAAGEVDRATGDLAPAAMAKSAGIELYARGSNLQNLQEARRRDAAREESLREVFEDAATRPADRAEAEAELAKIGDREQALQVAQGAMADRIQDDAFIAGFGNNGGEEFLSYLHLAEGLAEAEDAEAFATFRDRVLVNVVRVQEDDGAWSGHHCLTGKTFCTAAAVMSLCVER